MTAADLVEAVGISDAALAGTSVTWFSRGAMGAGS